MPVFGCANEADIPALSQLLSVLFTQEAEFKPNAQAQKNGLSMIIGNPDLGTILVAREGPCILAMVNLLFSASTVLGARVAIIEDMIVSQNARGIGIGSGLINHAIEFAKDSGAKRVTLLTDKDNHSAHRFYAKNGFTQSTMLTFRRSLE